jgi:molecular chaperone GrpE
MSESKRRPAGAPAEPPRPAGAPDPEGTEVTDPGTELREAGSDPATAAASESEHRDAGSDPATASASEDTAQSRGSDPTGNRESDPSDAAKVEADLDAMLEETKRERDEYLELAQRARADFENYRKRAARDASEAERRGKVSIARDLVPVLDNLERALLTAGVNPEGPDTEEAEKATEEVSAHRALAQGVALVYRELREALERAGVEAYDPAGESFDPSWHEALSTRTEDGVESGVVVETLQKGYRLDGQVLRAARVVVAE